MRKECIKANPEGGLSSEFILWELAGSWLSMENSTRLCLFRNRERKKGGILLELFYATGTSYRCRPFRAFGKWYIPFFGQLALSYDRQRDLLYLAGYGFYQRAEI